jgi:hypothetical protein
MMLGRYLWISHDTDKKQSDDIIIGISSKFNVDDRYTQMNLYKLVDLYVSPKLIVYAKAAFNFNLPGW